MAGPPKIPLEVRYERKIVRGSEPGDCWIWHGNRNQAGYGQFRVGRTGNGPVISVHRWAYERAKGPIATGLLVLHKCDNPRCSNPEHLYVGTQLDNARDRSERHPNARGYKRPVGLTRAGRICDDEVREIRAAEGTTGEIAARFGISEAYVHGIRTRRRKSGVPDLAEKKASNIPAAAAERLPEDDF